MRDYVNRDERHRLAISQPTRHGDSFFQFHAIPIGPRYPILQPLGVSTAEHHIGHIPKDKQQHSRTLIRKKN